MEKQYMRDMCGPALSHPKRLFRIRIIDAGMGVFPRRNGKIDFSTRGHAGVMQAGMQA
jgi:hypothetical protein